MLKRVLAMLLAFLPCVTVFAEEVPTGNLAISAPSAILVEAETGQVLFEQNSHDRRPPASVTKIMTMLLTVEAIDRGQISLDDMVRCSELAASMGGSQVYLEPNEEMSVRDMLKAVAVASGNDAAVALSEHIAGSAEGFVGMMNQRAQELGMNDTHFVNCNGLDDPEHLTSAYDIALMSRELTKHPLIFDFTGIWMDSLRGGAFGLVNTNKLIRFYEGANGLKTGSTSVAKFCLSASATKNNMTLIAVVLGAESSKERFGDASRLLDYGFANYAVADSLIAPDELVSIPVKKGSEETVESGIPEEFHVLVNKSKLSQVEKKITLPNFVMAPVREGDTLGEAEFFIDGVSVGKTPIVAKTASERVNPVDMFARLTKQLLYGQYH